MVNAIVFESPFCPVPLCGVRVLTSAVPGLVSRLAGTVAVIVVTSTKVWFCSFCPFHWMKLVLLNPLAALAFTVRRNDALPAGRPLGAIFVTVAPVLYWIELL